MKSLSDTRKGELLALLSIFPWALFPVLTKILVDSIPPIFAVAVSTLFATVFFGCVLTWNREWGKWKKITVWKEILLGTLLIGITYHALQFIGIQYTTAGNASILGLGEILFTFLFFGIWQQEKHSWQHIVGAACMIIGAFLVLFRNDFTNINRGDLIIVMATAIAPIGNYFQQKAVKALGAHFLLFIRSLISGVFLFALSWQLEGVISFDIFEKYWWVFVLNGFLALGLSKFLFLESFRFISVSKTVSLGSAAPLMALVYAYFILSEVPTLWQICGLIPIGFGIFFLTRK